MIASSRGDDVGGWRSAALLACPVALAPPPLPPRSALLPIKSPPLDAPSLRTGSPCALIASAWPLAMPAAKYRMCRLTCEAWPLVKSVV